MFASDFESTVIPVSSGASGVGLAFCRTEARSSFITGLPVMVDGGVTANDA